MQSTEHDVQQSNNSKKEPKATIFDDSAKDGHDDNELPSECEDFESMDLRPELYRGILSYGFEKPSAIQKQAIPAFFKKRDIIAQAQSGTGKTATFSISILQNIDVELGELQAAVIGPTRELAEQIYTVMKALSQFMGINIMLISGGVPVRQNVEDINKLKPKILNDKTLAERMGGMKESNKLEPNY